MQAAVAPARTPAILPPTARAHTLVTVALRDPAILEATLDDQERSVVLDLARRIHEQFDALVERVVVFGSRARGDAGEESDIDMLVVLRVTAAEELAAERDAWKLATAAMSDRRWVPLSLVVLAADRFQEELRRERRFALDVEREGIRL